jgi:CHAT domain-containing protein/tetratricopeptide (TPR) repeat protein
VKTVAERPPAEGDHPDAGTLAAHVERRLRGAEASRVDEHLAACTSCYEVFAEAVQFRLEEDAEEQAAAPAGAAVSSGPPRPRSVARAAVLLALAAALALASWAAWRAQRQPAAPALVADLVRAVGESRFVEPRLTGGFRYARFVRLRSGDERRTLDAQPAAVIAAVARIRERAEADPTPDALAALGVTYLVSGDADAAVRALESAAAQAPGEARIQSDLAAAYLTRASRLDEPADLPRGLEAAEKAVARPDAPAEAWFNRALALEALHLADQARKAWEDYLERDSASPWADEARRRLAELPPSRRSSLEEDRARVRDALAQGAASLERLTGEEPAVVRAYFDEVLLPAWAEAQLAPLGDAGALAAQATLVGEALLRRTGDALPRVAAAALRAPAAVSGRDPPRQQALGYRLLDQARRVDAVQRPACEAFREAHRLLSSGGSPCANAVRERVVARCLYPSQLAAARAELAVLESAAEAHAHLMPLARVRWLQGLIATVEGHLGVAIDRYRLALGGFVALGDAENQAFVHALMAEALLLVGDERRAWSERRSALSLLDRVRDPRRVQGILEEAALASLDARLPRAALDLLTALAGSGAARTSDATLCDALTRRAAVRLALDDEAGAASDLAAARGRLPGLQDAALSERMRAEIDAAEGALLAGTGREGSEGLLRRSIGYFDRAAPARVPALRLLAARALAARGSTDDAEGELLAGIRLVETERLSLRDVAQQASFLDQSLPLFDDMISLQVDVRRDPSAALAYLERGRGRQLADALGDGRPGRGEEEPPEPAAAGDTASLQRGLPEGVGLVYYAGLGPRVLAWRITRENVRFAPLAVSASEMSRLAAAHATALERRVSPDAVRRSSEALYDALVRPLGPLGPARALVFVPDAALHAVSFAALRDRDTGRFLVEDFVVGLAPSGDAFVRQSRGPAPRPARPHALVVGAPRVDASFGPGLDPLAAARTEAEDVAALYASRELLTGDAATKVAFLDALRRSDVVHYAGHALEAAGDPAGARLLLAPDPRTGEEGILPWRELPWRDLHARLVVLAACRSAGGAPSRSEGTLGLGRPFLAAGVPNVVGSLWDVDDEASRAFFVLLHRRFLAGDEPAEALRTAQLSFLRSGDATLAHPSAWAGFVSLGRLRPLAR